ncbi:MAG: sodium:solute symporter family protein [Acidobacteriota bacterium]
MSEHLLIWGGAAGYMLAMLGVGLWSHRRIHGSADFIVAGRRLPLWLATATLSATWFGGATILGAGGTAYSEGFYGVIPDPFGAGVCLLLAGLLVVRTVRRMRLMTVSDFFRVRYGRHADLVASSSMILTYAGWTAAQIVAIGVVLDSLANVPRGVGIVIGAVVVVTYTYFGGMWAVSITDFLQIAILVAGLTVIFPMMIAACGGPAAFLDGVPEGSFGLLPPAGTDAAGWVHWIRAWIVLGLGNLAGQDLLQRSLSSRDETVAQNSAYLSGLFYLSFGLIPVLIGLAGTILMPGMASTEAELIIPEMARRFLPAPVMALFVGALLAAIMSSADSALLAPASIVGENLLRYFRPGVSEGRVLRWTRNAVPVIGLMALLLGLYSGRVYELLVESFALLLVVLFPSFLAGIWWRRANTPGALGAMTVGLVTFVALRTAAAMEWMGLAYPADVIAVVLAGATLVVVSLATGRSHPPRRLTDLDGRPIPMAGRLGLPGPGRPRPAPGAA